MRKTKILLALVLGIIIGAASAVAIYILTTGDIAWREYLEEKLVPNAVIVISAIGTLCLAFLPIIREVRHHLGGFSKAANDINSTVAMGDELKRTVQDQNERIDNMSCRFDSLERDIDSLNQKLDNNTVAILHVTEDTEKIVKIGFGNMNELVAKGLARKIQRVGEATNEAANEEK